MLYLPYPDFELSAKVFSSHDLRNQVIQVVDLMEVLHETDKAKKNFDIRLTQMWKGYELQLCVYGYTLLEELNSRNPPMPVNRVVINRLNWHFECANDGDFKMEKPPWVGTEAIHRSHRSQLITINSQYYGLIFQTEPDDLPLAWPDVSN